jgi:hypothetical protein
MTDNEIINVLEICVNKTDVFVIHHNAETREYDKISIKDILGVINHQKAEIENYKQIAENQQSVSMDKEVEIKRLKAEVERLEQRNITSCRNWQSKYNTLRADAVKEFAERLKAESVYLGIDTDCFICTVIGEWKSWETVGEWCEETIDKIYKEMGVEVE